ncbi:SusC/RagA family protein, partial [Alistipes onderdonkii]
YYTSLSKYSIMDGLPTIMNKGGHYNKDKTDNMSTTTELTWTPVKGLEIKGNFTYMFNTQHNLNRQVNTEYSQYPGEVQTLSTGSRFQDKLYEKTMMHNYYQANVYATYAHTWNEKHNFKAMAGFNWETKYLKDVSATGYNLLSETLMDLNLVGQDADGNERMEVGGGQNEYALMGFFGRLNYDYKGKYLVEVSGRYDGSSKFPIHSKWGFFPSASVAWRISDETWMGWSRRALDNAKIRLSAGSMGNGNVSPYSYTSEMTVSTADDIVLGGSYPSYTSVGSTVPVSLTWEKSTTYDLGLDLDFLNNRLSVSGDYYRRYTTDMYTPSISLPSVYGTTSPKGNNAELRTTGWALSLTSRDSFKLGGKPFDYSIKAMVW